MSDLHHEQFAAAGSADYDPRYDSTDDECPDCTCCTRLGCYRGRDSDCLTPEGDYLCPCTDF